jgi:hypothetical protein
MTALGRDARALVARVKRRDGPSEADRARLRRMLEPAWAAQRAQSISELPELAPRTTHGWLSWTSGLLIMSLGFVAPEASPTVAPAAPQVAGSPAAISRGVEQAPVEKPGSAVEARRSEPTPHAGRARPRASRKTLQPTAASSVAQVLPVTQPLAADLGNAPAQAPARRSRAPLEPSAAVAAGSSRAVAADGGELAPTVRSRAFAPQPIDDELTWLSAAQEALRNGQPSAALRLVQEHAFRFPQGALASERVAVQALALCALSRKAAARDVLADLEHRAPNSPLLARVRRNCGF